MNTLLNGAVYQTLWIAIVLGAARGHDWLGITPLLIWLPIHFWLSTRPRSDFALLVILGTLGPLLDTALMHGRLASFKGLRFDDSIAPIWLFALWANFALTLNHAARWVIKQPLVAVLVGAIGGPLAYWAGARMGAAELSSPLWRPLVALAVIWGLTLPAIGWALKPPHRHWAQLTP